MNETHLGGARIEKPDPMLWMPEIWQNLIDCYGVKSMVDVGCGAGWTVDWFLKHGVSAIGVEGCEETRNQSPVRGSIIPHDYTKGPLEVPACDLAWSAEFVEHVEEKYIRNFMATFSCARQIVMTHARPGQTGFHHVNEQPMDYWIMKMLERGFALSAMGTLHLRSLHPISGTYGVQTLLYFCR